MVLNTFQYQEIPMTETATVLSAKRVDEIFHACLFKDEEDHTNFLPGSGITTNVGFHPGRIEEHKAEIIEMLNELPDVFKESAGGGASFLEAYNDRHGNQWTGMDRAMEQLFQLGLATGKVSYLLPRSAWSALPRGMPYYVVNNEPKDVMLMTG
jgi:hypothetical protein